MTRLRDNQIFGLICFTGLLFPVSFAIAYALTAAFDIPIWITLIAAWLYSIPLPGFLGLVYVAGGTKKDWDETKFPWERQRDQQIASLESKIKQLQTQVAELQEWRAQ